MKLKIFCSFSAFRSFSQKLLPQNRFFPKSQIQKNSLPIHPYFSQQTNQTGLSKMTRPLVCKQKSYMFFFVLVDPQTSSSLPPKKNRNIDPPQKKINPRDFSTFKRARFSPSKSGKPKRPITSAAAPTCGYNPSACDLVGEVYCTLGERCIVSTLDFICQGMLGWLEGGG